ncbi:MAG: LPP20 family lipoprotein, partial [Flavobacteriales bacterium]
MQCLIWIAVISCAGKKSAVSNKDQVPEWVKARPLSSDYYTGIASVDKRYQLDYQAEAKRKALDEMASEISVRVQGETFMNTLEVNNSFSEEYISNIRTSTDAKIDDYETVGIYETADQYWVYYRINKASYWANIAQKKRKVLDVAYDYYSKGKTAEEQLNIAGAYDLYMHGLVSMKDYWNEPNDYLCAEGKLFLDNELYQRIYGLYDNLKISVSEKSVVL